MNKEELENLEVSIEIDDSDDIMPKKIFSNSEAKLPLQWGPSMIKAKPRWVFAATDENDKIILSSQVVKISGRPSVNIQETLLDDAGLPGSKTWIPGKQNWNNITISYQDVDNEVFSDFYQYFSDLYNLEKGKYTPNNPKKGMSFLQGKMEMYAGNSLLETWKLHGMFPISVNFGDELDYSNSSLNSKEIVFRYNEVMFVLEPYKQNVTF